MHFLLSYLNDLEASKPLARVFKTLIDQELANGDSAVQERVIGLVNFPLAHLNKSAGYDYSDNIDIDALLQP